MILSGKKSFPKTLLLLSLLSYLAIYMLPGKTEITDTYESSSLHQSQQLTLHNTLSLSPGTTDYSVDSRLSYETNEGRCDEILLFMPYFYAGHGQGFQLNCYQMAAAVAAFLDKALVVIEPPHSENRYETWSQFGCPADAFADGSRAEVKDGFPEGLLRLIQHPNWIGRGCPVPTCGNTHDYNRWAKLRMGQRKQWKHNSKQKEGPVLPPVEVECIEGGRNVKVIPMDGADVRMFFETIYRGQMLDRSSPESRERAYNWATRLGAADTEAQYFSNIQSEVDIWDFISALANRSGLLRLQPWIARDVAEYIKSSGLPPNTLYDAIHVRRGDKLVAESKPIVQKYWQHKGYRKHQLPTNFIPFLHYLKQGWDGSDCPTLKNGRRKKVRNPPRTVYVATDDPSTLRTEIGQMPKVKGKGGHTVLNECHTATFVFSPASQTTETAFHLTPCQNYLGTCQDDDCFKRYERNIIAIADLMILGRAEKFVGEYSSNWGRLIKGFRTIFNDDLGAFGPDVENGTPVIVKDTVEVFGFPPTPFGY